MRIARPLGALTLVALALPAWAATITVTKGSDDAANPPAGSLRDAVNKAQPGDTIEIQSGVTVTLVADLPVPAAAKNVTIQGPPPDAKKPAKVTGEGPKKPAHKLIVQADGVTVRQIEFDDVPLTVDHATGDTVSRCDFTGARSGVVVDGATTTAVGTDSEPNTFKNCDVGVTCSNSTGTTVTQCEIKGSKTCVGSTDDTNVVVTDCVLDGVTCVDLEGSSGEVTKVAMTPGGKDGIGVNVGPSPSGGAVKGPVKIDGNQQVKLKGNAKAVKVTGRADVTVDGNKVSGKTSGVAFDVEPGATAAAGQQLNVTNNVVAGAGGGIFVDFSSAPVETVVIEGNLLTGGAGQGGGIFADGGPNGVFTVSGNTVTGFRPFGIHVSSQGGTFACDANTIDRPKGDGLDVSGSSRITLGTLTVTNAKKPAVFIDSGATAILDGATFQGNKGPDVLVADGGTFAAPLAVVDAADPPGARLPQVDVAPRGWGTTGATATIDDAGNLTVHAPPGTTDVRIMARSDGPFSIPHEVARDVVDSSGDAVIDLSKQPPGSFTVQFLGFAFDPSTGDPAIRGEASVKWNGVKTSGGGGATFEVSKTLLTLTAAANNDTSEDFTVTNKTNQSLPITVSQLNGVFGVVPSGQITLAPNEVKQFTCGFSSTKPGTFKGSFTISGSGKTVTVHVDATAH